MRPAFFNSLAGVHVHALALTQPEGIKYTNVCMNLVPPDTAWQQWLLKAGFKVEAATAAQR